MDRRGLAMVFSVLILAGTLVLGLIVPKGFIPSEDTGQLNGTTETAEGTSYDAMVKHQRAAAAIVQEDPNVEGFMSSVGAGGRSASVNQGRLFIHLKPRDDRDQSADEVAQSLTRKLAAVPGMRVFITNPPVINIGGRQSKSLYQFTLQGSDIGDLYAGAATPRAAPARHAGHHGRHERPPDQEPAGARWPSTATARRRSASTSIRSRARSTTPTARARSAPSTRRTTSTGWSWSCCPQYQRDLSALSLLHITGREGVSVPLGSARAGDARRPGRSP